MSEQTIPESLLAKVRALLAKAEDPAATTAEAEAFTAKATELMAKYGIEQAMIADRADSSDAPGNRIITTSNPWAAERAKLVYWLAEAMRCKPIMLGKEDGDARVHIFGFASDLERVELLYTSLLLQMTTGLTRVHVPYYEKPRAYRRSWLIGFVNEVTSRVREAERSAVAHAEAERQATTNGESSVSTGRSTALVLADREQAVRQAFAEEYPSVRKSRTTFTGSGYGAGQAAGRRANIGQTGLAGGRRAIGGVR